MTRTTKHALVAVGALKMLVLVSGCGGECSTQGPRDQLDVIFTRSTNTPISFTFVHDELVHIPLVFGVANEGVDEATGERFEFSGTRLTLNTDGAEGPSNALAFVEVGTARVAVDYHVARLEEPGCAPFRLLTADVTLP